MGELILHESFEGSPLRDSLCFKLASTAAESPAGGPMEICLLPLDLYNDAARLIKNMQAAYLIPGLTTEANDCLESLLGIVSTKVPNDFTASAQWLQSKENEPCTQLSLSCISCSKYLHRPLYVRFESSPRSTIEGDPVLFSQKA